MNLDESRSIDRIISNLCFFHIELTLVYSRVTIHHSIHSHFTTKSSPEPALPSPQPMWKVWKCGRLWAEGSFHIAQHILDLNRS